MQSNERPLKSMFAFWVFLASLVYSICFHETGPINLKGQYLHIFHALLRRDWSGSIGLIP